MFEEDDTVNTAANESKLTLARFSALMEWPPESRRTRYSPSSTFPHSL